MPTWIEEALQVPEWATAEMEESMASNAAITETWEVFAEVPMEIRPLFVSRAMLEVELGMARLATFPDGNRPDPQWCGEQIEALNGLIAVSLRHAGIRMDNKVTYALGAGWKLVIQPKRMIVTPDAATSAMIIHGSMLAGKALARRATAGR